MSKQLKFGSSVRITWYDSRIRGGWRQGMSPNELGRVRSIGYVTEDNPKFITLTTSISKDMDVLDPITIPKGAIVLVERIEGFDR